MQLLKRLFFAFTTTTDKRPPVRNPIPETNVERPIQVKGELNDCSLVVLGQIKDAANLLGVDLFTSRLYRLYMAVVHMHTYPDQVKEKHVAKMKYWVNQPTFPIGARLQLVQLFVELDGLNPQLRTMSQMKFERLRVWSNSRG